MTEYNPALTAPSISLSYSISGVRYYIGILININIRCQISAVRYRHAALPWAAKLMVMQMQMRMQDTCDVMFVHEVISSDSTTLVCPLYYSGYLGKVAKISCSLVCFCFVFCRSWFILFYLIWRLFLSCFAPVSRLASCTSQVRILPCIVSFRSPNLVCYCKVPYLRSLRNLLCQSSRVNFSPALRPTSMVPNNAISTYSTYSSPPLGNLNCLIAWGRWHSLNDR